MTSFRNLESIFRRGSEQELDLQPADPAAVAIATHALLLAGAGPDWWPYAVLVSPEMVAVHLAGANCPAPRTPWRPGPDPRLWLGIRDEIRRTAEYERLAHDPATAEKGPRPVLLGVYQQGLVYIDVARAPGPLVVSGAEPWAAKVRDLLDSQLSSEALVHEQQPERLPDTYWPIRVFDGSTISMLGCALAGVVKFPELMRSSMAQRRALAFPPTPAAAASAQALTRAQAPASMQEPRAARMPNQPPAYAQQSQQYEQPQPFGQSQPYEQAPSYGQSQPYEQVPAYGQEPYPQAQPYGESQPYVQAPAYTPSSAFAQTMLIGPPGALMADPEQASQPSQDHMSGYGYPPPAGPGYGPPPMQQPMYGQQHRPQQHPGPRRRPGPPPLPPNAFESPAVSARAAEAYAGPDAAPAAGAAPAAPPPRPAAPQRPAAQPPRPPGPPSVNWDDVAVSSADGS